MTQRRPPDDQLLTSLALALASVGHLVDGVAAAQWTAPTPCPEWDVRQLVNHLVAGNLAVAALVAAGTHPGATVTACRQLFGNHAGSQPAPFAGQHAIAMSAGWSALILLACVPLAVRAYRSATTR